METLINVLQLSLHGLKNCWDDIRHSPITALVQSTEHENLISRVFFCKLAGFDVTELDSRESLTNHWVLVAWSFTLDDCFNPITYKTWHKLSTFSDCDMKFMDTNPIQLPLRQKPDTQLPQADQKSTANPPTHTQPLIKGLTDARDRHVTNKTLFEPKSRFSIDRTTLRVSKAQGRCIKYRLRAPAYPRPFPTNHLQAYSSETNTHTTQSQKTAGESSKSNTATSASSLPDSQAGQDNGVMNYCEASPPSESSGTRNQVEELNGDWSSRLVKGRGIWADPEARRLSFKLLNPSSEYEANADAVSSDCRDLFESLSWNTETPHKHPQDIPENYWKWNEDEQAWFHLNEDTQSLTRCPMDS
ncbi:uncharacterized protein BCR38DRAFT_487010 [Pseudomassariella vexata]|uniref:Uncharacterized protein n=1 Tax=Pseudomassariella vexata TaxID=1141098 RepID=A0A1Y2DPP0_9PEZI|nr:uncharacterized protein BCR38DRAFT_487010 [Pseudomassariella vexata]ORY61253.1 hypothetical protein BCR38DRAFT_487010 [Pseudomassariella vexata]